MACLYRANTCSKTGPQKKFQAQLHAQLARQPDTNARLRVELRAHEKARLAEAAEGEAELRRRATARKR